MSARLAVIVLLFLALAAGLGGLGISLYDASRLSAATASLQRQQAFDHQQTQRGQAELQAVVKAVEKHLDGTIRSSVTLAAERVAREFGK